ncbi:4Fe-4S binding protein [Geoalkalibacter sp.]|uniref:4Fe-4S binding protein n=1 Tax=Geoalkalibacter sp. TaxID=3041440 RepID=UPI00272EE0DD|nr:4Fe-4S binding protein [Geoalkalibacter sp.]
MRLRHLRIAVQLLCLGVFLLLFLLTEYRGADVLVYPVSLLFRIDPLAALADALAPGAFGWALLWPALLLLLLTLVLGRFFCGWICPLGTTLDGLGKLVGRGLKTPAPGWRRCKYYLLILLVVAGLLGLQLIGLFDPLAIFLRTLTLSLYPAWNLTANHAFEWFYHRQLPVLSPLADAVYPFFDSYLLAFHPPAFTLAVFTLAVFFAIVALEKVERRFWCKNLCPLGALLGLCARHALLRREPEAPCADCSACLRECRGGAVAGRGHRGGECLLCMDCEGFCPQGRVRRRFGSPKIGQGVDLSRRGVLTSLTAGLVLAPVAGGTPAVWQRHSYLLRPPGAVEESEFQRRCIRCGECMKVCIGGALHPALLDAGPLGLWTPVLVPRIGYCEYNCTLCGQVCPTGAIRRLSLEEKHKTVIGIAYFDQNRCIPFARGEECLVCEEHCPTGEKAIVFDVRPVRVGEEERLIKLPRVVRNRCIGCGICETRCPVAGVSPVRVTNEGESRRPHDPWA